MRAILVAVVGGIALAVVVLGRLVRSAMPSWRLRWWLHRRAVRRFVAACAGGHPDVAERAAARVLGGRGHPRPGAPGRPGGHRG